MNNVTSRTASEPDNASNLYVNNVIAIIVVIAISDPHLLHHRHNCNDHYDLENLVPGSRSSRGGPVILNVTGSAWWWLEGKTSLKLLATWTLDNPHS